MGPVSDDGDIGYYLMLDNQYPNYDDKQNHIHIYNIVTNETTILITYSLKILNRHVRLSDYEVKNSIEQTFYRENEGELLRQTLHGRHNADPKHYIKNGDYQNNIMLIPLVNDAMNDAVDRFSNIAKILLVLRSILQEQMIMTRPT